MNLKKRYIKFLLKFRYAFRGLVVAFKTQSSFRIHVFAAILAYILGCILSITLTQWALLNASILFVIVAELFNTAIEHICDFIHPRLNKMIKIIKDISAGAVMVAVVNAIIIGVLIFWPKIVTLF